MTDWGVCVFTRVCLSSVIKLVIEILISRKTLYHSARKNDVEKSHWVRQGVQRLQKICACLQPALLHLCIRTAWHFAAAFVNKHHNMAAVSDRGSEERLSQCLRPCFYHHVSVSFDFIPLFVSFPCRPYILHLGGESDNTVMTFTSVKSFKVRTTKRSN